MRSICQQIMETRNFSPEDLSLFRDLIYEKFSQEELSQLLFDLGIDEDDLSGKSRLLKAQDLVTYLARRDELLRLVNLCSKLRPSINWHTIFKKPTNFFQDKLSQSIYLDRGRPSLIGRKAELDTFLKVLDKNFDLPVVAIIGMGGIGKTTLANEIAHIVGDQFDFCIWRSAKTERFDGRRVVKYSSMSDFLEIEDLLRIVRSNVLTQQSDDNKNAINKRLLVILDNLESLSQDDESYLIDSLVKIIGTGKILITSRRDVFYPGVVKSVTLKGMTESDSIAFLKREVERCSFAIKNSELILIHKATGGTPLAMQLVIGQLQKCPLPEILKVLKLVNPLRESENFYRYVYMNSWQLISMHAKSVLLALSAFEANSKIPFDAVIDMLPNLTNAGISTAIGELLSYSLAEFSFDTNTSIPQYSLHPLTLNFIISDIARE